MENFIKINKKIKKIIIVLVIITMSINLILILKEYVNKRNEKIYYFNYQDTNFQMGYSEYCYKVNENLFCEVKGKDVPVFWYSYIPKKS